MAQNEVPFYEQRAFDFYRNSILSQKPINKKVTVYAELEPYAATENPYWYPRCLESFKLSENDSLRNNISNQRKLNLAELKDKRFRVKKYGKGSYPKLYVSQSFSINDNQIFVNVNEIHKWNGNIYHIEFDSNGKVINWCKGGYVE